MKKESFAVRLQKALNENNMKPIDLANKSKISKSLISKYLSGVAKARDDNLSTLAETLNTNEAWLMGYDVPINPLNQNQKDELQTIEKILKENNILDTNDKISKEDIERYMDFTKRNKDFIFKNKEDKK